MKRYLLNSPVLTAYGDWRYRGPLSLEQARDFVRAAAFDSAIGHAATAAHLSAKLGVPVPCARVAIQMQPGDVALVFRLEGRPAEGAVFDELTLSRLPQSFGLLERLT